MSTVRKSPLAKGASIEYKYKDKDWKNGIVKSKTNTHMIIIIHKNINKQKQIQLRMCDVITLLHIKKTLKLSNQIYPQWIAIHTTVKIIYPKSQLSEIAKIGHYRDNKSISFYFPKQKHEKRLLIIKQRDIKTIDDYGITTYDGKVIGMVYGHTQTAIQKNINLLQNFSFFTKIQNILKDLYDIPSEICVMIYEYTICAFLPMYTQMNYNIQNTQSVKIWHANTITVYGAIFKCAIDILCRGVEIYAQFGKVRTYAILSIGANVYGNFKEYKGIMDTMYDEQDGIRRFLWENNKVIKISKDVVCRLGFFVSDGASVTKYVKYRKNSPQIFAVNNFQSIKWQFMNRNNHLRAYNPWRYGDKTFETSYDWHPVVQLLV